MLRRIASTWLCVVLLGTTEAFTGVALSPGPQTRADQTPTQDPRLIELQNLRWQEVREKDPTRRLKLLNDIIDLSIPLGLDYAADRAERDRLEKAIQETEAKQEREERLRKELVQSKRSAKEKLDASPPDLDGALTEIVKSEKIAEDLGKVDPEIAVLRAQWDSLRTNKLYTQIATVVLVAIMLIGAVQLFRKKGASAVKIRELEMLEGPDPGEIYKLDKERIRLGAVAAEADVVIADPFRKISRRHCEIERNGKHYFLTDCSTNGTRINNKVIPKDEPVLLKKGDLIALADDVILRFR